jgi:hypothetical protein
MSLPIQVMVAVRPAAIGFGQRRIEYETPAGDPVSVDE